MRLTCHTRRLPCSGLIEKFLRQNGGHLAQPTSIFILSSLGLHVQPAPSKDGNALATALDQATGTVRSRGTAGDVFGQAEQFQTSISTLTGIADNEAHKPGRKVLIWIGPGWPMLTDRRFIQTNESKEGYFHTVVSLSKKLREARITLYSIYAVVGVSSHGLFEAFLKPLQEPRKAETGYLALQVLAMQRPPPRQSPITVANHMVAAVVMPRTISCLRTMAPAPMKPTPVRMPRGSRIRSITA